MINIKNITFSYKRKSRKIFNNINLTMNTGHIYGLLGKNGTGKTTLLKIITGLLYPDSGSVEIFSKNSANREPSLMQNLFFVQDNIILPKITARKYADIYSNYYPKFNNDKFFKYLKDFDIEPDTKLTSMSFGQKKKAYISFALACNTDLLIMDEPTNGMDIPSKKMFQRMIATLATSEKLIIISTHIVKDIDKLLDSIIIIDKDDIIINSSIEDITKHLTFKIIEENDIPLYTEDTLFGTCGVIENKSPERADYNIDLEMLFNTVLNDKETIKTIFKK